MPGSPQIGELIRRARDGDMAALGVLFAEYRDRLRAAADRQLGGRIAARIDASDIVQQTCLEAQRDFARFLGTAEPELAAWLERILERNVIQAIRDHTQVQMRAVGRERPIDDSADSTRNTAGQLAAVQSSPSQRAMREEEAARLARALDQLPTDQREAVRLRFFDGLSLDEIAARLNRSVTAAAGLVKRGLDRLRHQFKEDE